MLPYLTAAIVLFIRCIVFPASFDRDSRQLIKAEKKIQNNEIHVPVVKRRRKRGPQKKTSCHLPALQSTTIANSIGLYCSRVFYQHSTHTHTHTRYTRAIDEAVFFNDYGRVSVYSTGTRGRPDCSIGIAIGLTIAVSR